MKKCGRCKTEKPLDEFHRNAASKDGKAHDCKVCARARAKAWNEANKQRANEKSRNWQKENRARRKQYMKSYYAANRDKLIAANIKWNRDHPDVVKAVNAEYRKRVKEDRTTKLKQVVNTAKINAEKRGFECNMTFEMLDAYVKCQSEKCSMTGFDFDYSTDENYRVRPFAPSIDRIDSSKGYTFDNIQVVCAMVNLAKNEMSQKLFDMMCRARAEMLNSNSPTKCGNTVDA